MPAPGSKPETPFLLAVMGPTASGKTALAEALADRFDALLLNADAFQAYRGMDIGTAKPNDKARYALVDIKDPDEPYGVGEFVLQACEHIEGAWSRRRSVIVVGGTGLYIRALFEEYAELQGPPDPNLRAELERREAAEGLPSLFTELLLRNAELASKTDSSNPQRVRRALERTLSGSKSVAFRLPPFHRLKFGLERPVANLDQIIEVRAQQMVQNGWATEVSKLRAAGYRKEDPGLQALGYRAIWDYLENRIGLQEALATTIAATRQYAKRQRTWLRSEPGLVMLPDGSALEIFDRAMGAMSAVLS